jgi:CRP-like cAMP-binding protein
MSVDPARLSSVPLFSSLSEGDLAEVAGRMEPRRVSEGERLSIEGASGYFFFVIDEGTAQVTREGETLAELGPGDFFGETAILKNLRRTATVTAASPMTVAVMFGADFARMKAEHPAICDRIETAMAERAAQLPST